MKLPTLSILVFCLCLPAGVASAAVTQNSAVSSSQANCSIGVSGLTAEEMKWYKTFQEGTFLIEGWKDITKNILAHTPEKLREHQQCRLEQLGRKIGMEWSRENAVRRVDNNMLQQWGKELKKAAKKNPKQLPEVIASIDQQLDNLLN
ncbi:MAG TPA: hypothetical protein ENK96_06350 [Desulfobulbaceae bacterium]|nr:hypothetical protein [Desulfobulbaceae bacterium]